MYFDDYKALSPAASRITELGLPTRAHISKRNRRGAGRYKSRCPVTVSDGTVVEDVAVIVSKVVVVPYVIAVSDYTCYYATDDYDIMYNIIISSLSLDDC